MPEIGIGSPFPQRIFHVDFPVRKQASSQTAVDCQSQTVAIPAERPAQGTSLFFLSPALFSSNMEWFGAQGDGPLRAHRQAGAAPQAAICQNGGDAFNGNGSRRAARLA
jgi:hypothetical protein